MLKDQYQVGKTKLFFKAGFVAGQLEKIRARVIEEGKIKVKAQMQMWRTRREYKRKLQATQTFQRFTRGWIDRRAVRQLRRVQAIEIIQRYLRRWIVLKKIRADQYQKVLAEKSDAAATTIQKAYKSYVTSFFSSLLPSSLLSLTSTNPMCARVPRIVWPMLCVPR